MEEDKLDQIRALLLRLWGHYAMTEELRGRIRKKAYLEGSTDGYARGFEAGKEAGFSEGKIFPQARDNYGTK